MQCLDDAIPYAGVGRLQVPLAIARGEVLVDNDKSTDARSSFERALHIADEDQGPHEYRGYAQLGIAKSALLAGDFNQAVQDALSATEAGVKRGDIEQTVTALKVLAESYRGLKQPEQAAKTLQTAVSLIATVPTDELDGEKRATYLATQHSVFSELTDLYASADPTTALAFVTSERGRARSLRYATSQSRGDTPMDRTTPPTARYQQMLQHVVEMTVSKTNLLAALAQQATHEGH